jgi:hypothetical protein
MDARQKKDRHARRRAHQREQRRRKATALAQAFAAAKKQKKGTPAVKAHMRRCGFELGRTHDAVNGFQDKDPKVLGSWDRDAGPKEVQIP